MHDDYRLARWPQVRPNWPKITYNVNYLEGHTLADPLERVDAYHWWLNLGSHTGITSAQQLAIWAG